MTGRLLVIGSSNVDLLARVSRHPSPGETLLGTQVSRSAGGKGANQALAAALQGAHVTFVGAVGDDADAEVALAGLRAAGVDCGRVGVVEETSTGAAIITVSEDGENTVVVIPGANAHVTESQAIAALEAAGPGDLVLMQYEVPRPTTEAAVRAARRAGHRVVLNVAPWGPLDRDVLAAADPLVVNEHEARLALEALSPTSPESDPAAMAGALHRAGVTSVVLTLGAEGAVVVDGDGAATLVPSPRVSAVDSTGAGDAFTGALAARLLAGDSLHDATRRAVRVGAYSVQHPGAQPSYPRGELDLPE